ncbi:MAG TPA: prolyl oligopeptidase family serine peptidase [Terracidiphilus sp.]|nr:prolyl oligopeptidase family serine peptidase [Terracidiphilus sp.]
MHRSSRYSSRVLLSVLLLTTAPFMRADDQSRFPSTDDLRQLKSLGGPLLSPDGKRVLVTMTDSTADGGKSHLWLVSATTGEKPRQITFSPPADKRGERSPQWAPDGSAVYFLAKRGEQTQLFRLDLRGGEAAAFDLKIVPSVDRSKEKNAIPPPGAQKSEADKKTGDKAPGKPEEKKGTGVAEPIAIDVAGYAPSPDGKWLALWAKDPETPGEKKQKDAKADAVWVNHEAHLTRLYLAALRPDGSLDGALKAVGAEPDVQRAMWSQDSARMLVVTEKPNDVSDLGPANAAWLLEMSAPEKATKLNAIPATVGGAAWSPNGETIVFAAATPEDAPPGYDELFALPRETSGAKIVPLSSGFAGQVNASALYFPPEGGLVAQAGIGTRSAVVRLSLDGKTPVSAVDLGAPVVTGLNTNRKQTGWVWLAESGGQPVKLCYAQRLGDACAALTIPELAPTNLRSVEPEIVQWKNGKFTVDGLLYLPPGTGSARVPLIVDVHGGPFGAWENRHDAFAAFLVGHGWAVLRPNPRGSSNYGVAFAAANKNDLGGGDYEDIMAGVDAVLAKYPVDPARMALIGYSYGGEMAAFVEGKTDRFRAIVSAAPVIDQFSEYGTEHGSWYDRWYFGKPWEHRDDAWRQSPLAGAAKAKTPFLLIQGESDTTDPLGQAQEMYRALRQEGVAVELVTYPREDHGPLAGGAYGRPSTEPWHGYDVRQRMIEFIEKAFSGESSNSAAAQPSR